MKKFLIGLAIGAFVILLWVGAFLYYASVRRAAADKISRLPPAPAAPDLRAIVTWDLNGVAIKNVDPEKRRLKNVVLKLNMGAWGRNDGEAGAGDIGPSQTVLVPFLNFVDGDRRRFKILDRDLQTVFIRGELESGMKSAALFICSGGQVCARAPE